MWTGKGPQGVCDISSSRVIQSASDNDSRSSIHSEGVFVTRQVLGQRWALALLTETLTFTAPHQCKQVGGALDRTGLILWMNHLFLGHSLLQNLVDLIIVVFVQALRVRDSNMVQQPTPVRSVRCGASAEWPGGL